MKTCSVHARCLLLAALGLSAAGCFFQDPIMESVVLACPERLEVDRTVQLKAVGRYVDGKDRTYGITWSTSDERVATINHRGFLTTHQPGSVIVRAEKDGKVDEQTLLVTPVLDGLKIHFSPPPDWREPNVYIYRAVGANTIQYTGEWPGTRMTPEGGGWYVFAVEGLADGKVIFNDGNVQDPRPHSAGFNRTRGTWWYDGEWHVADPAWREIPPPGADRASPEEDQIR